MHLAGTIPLEASYLSDGLWVQWLVVTEARVLPRRRGPSNRRAVDLLEGIVPADVGQAAVAWSAPPLRTVVVEATALQQAPGVTGQVWGPQVNGRVGKSMWGVEGTMAITGSTRTPSWRGWFSSFSLSGHNTERKREKRRAYHTGQNRTDAGPVAPHRPQERRAFGSPRTTRHLPGRITVRMSVCRGVHVLG